jgi:peptide methionine sulfoxide reductase MsrB
MDASIRQQIERRAYEIYLSRGGEHGSHDDDWTIAEKEIMDELNSKHTANKIQQIHTEETSPTAESDLEHVVPEEPKSKSKRVNSQSSNEAVPAKKRTVKKKADA